MTQRQEKLNIPIKEIQHIADELNESNNNDERYCQNISLGRQIFTFYVAVLPYIIRFFGIIKY